MNIHIVNLTPHALNIYNEDGALVECVAPSGTVARVEVKRERQPDLVRGHGLMELPVYTTTHGEVEGLPGDSDLGKIYVVSGMTRAACPGRVDVYQPGELLRNDDGQVVGCIGLSR